MRGKSARVATIVLGAIVAGGVAACGGDDSTTGGGEDAGTDAPVISDGGKLDTGTDSTVDGGADTGVDAPIDTGQDALVDAPADATDASDASSDASDGAADASDGAADASDGAADGGDGGPLACTTWRYADPIVLEDLTGGDGGTPSYFNGPVWVGEVATDQVRVLSQPSSSAAFRVYAIDKSAADGGADAAAPAVLDGPAGPWTFEKAHHYDLGTSKVTEVLIQRPNPDGGDGTELWALLLDDTTSIAGPLPSSIALGTGGRSPAALPLDANTVFAAVTFGYSQGPTNYYALGVERGTTSSAGTPGIVSLSANVGDFRLLQLAHSGTDAYVFGSNSKALTGESVWKVADTAVVPAKPLIRPFQVSGRTFETGTAAYMVDVAPASATDTSNFAYYSAAPDGSSATFRVGQVPGASLDTVVATDLTTVRTYSDLSLQVAIDGQGWWGDDMMIVGPGLPPKGGGDFQGVDALWVNAAGVVRAEQKGASGLLHDRGSVRTANAAPASLGTAQARWNVAWIESRAGGGEVLLFNELLCQ